MISLYLKCPETAGCSGGNECCNDDNKCGIHEGNCHSDKDCMNGLICGTNNCAKNHDLWWDSNDNCCEKPEGVQ